MKCPYCSAESTKVIDTRESAERVRRRRECDDCGRRFTTYETVERFDTRVVKRDEEVEEFREEKIRSGIERAAEKTSLEQEDVDEIVENVKKKVLEEKEIDSSEIGEFVKKELQKKDEVAYIRFASVYDSFEDAESFQEEVESLKGETV